MRLLVKIIQLIYY